MNNIYSNPAECCKELSRVWKALGVTRHAPGHGSCAEHVASLRARLREIETTTLLEATDVMARGELLSEFMLSFPAVQQMADLAALTIKRE